MKLKELNPDSTEPDPAHSSAHTPGPWSVADEQILSDTLNEYGNFNVCVFKRYGDLTAQDKANMRLIAAAPDLLAALKRVSLRAGLANDIQHSGETVPAEVWSELYQVTNEARAAIAKAEGNQ